jgi:hypothetical protein
VLVACPVFARKTEAHSAGRLRRWSSIGGHTPGHSVVRLASGGERLTFAGDAVFAVGFDQPDWHNGFEHDPEEAARLRLLRELAATGEMLVATHLPFPSCRTCGGGRRRFVGTGLTACWVRAEPGLVPSRRGRSSDAGANFASAGKYYGKEPSWRHLLIRDNTAGLFEPGNARWRSAKVYLSPRTITPGHGL